MVKTWTDCQNYCSLELPFSHSEDLVLLTFTGDWFVVGIPKGDLTFVTGVHHTGGVLQTLTLSRPTLILITQHWSTAISTHCKVLKSRNIKIVWIINIRFFLILIEFVGACIWIHSFTRTWYFGNFISTCDPWNYK